MASTKPTTTALNRGDNRGSQTETVNVQSARESGFDLAHLLRLLRTSTSSPAQQNVSAIHESSGWSTYDWPCAADIFYACNDTSAIYHM